MTISSALLHVPAARQWEKVGIHSHHGINIPLFSLHSATSHGIGEFPDLLPLIEWCKTVGLDVIQLLPLNDTGLGTSPYSAISAFALNPLHLGLHTLPYLDQFQDLKEHLESLPKLQQTIRLQYASVRKLKEDFFTLYLEKAGALIQQEDKYKDFVEKSSWLKGFAVFKTLKIHHGWWSWEDWPEDLRNPTPALIDQLIELYRDEVERHCILQYLCDQQLHAAKQKADELGVYLMGDIPILTSRDSADVWLHRDLFYMRYSAGAPPDIFSADGQNWGFPIYNWEAIAKQNYNWWVERLQRANHYYHIYRIDHIIGFFRIWAIPPGMSGKDGHFTPIDPTTWIDHGQRIMLMMIQNCDMLPIGEDLGIVPDEVKVCLMELGICGTRVIRWERVWKEEGRFIPFENYPPISMTTVSTHDSESLQTWWKLHPMDAKAYCHLKNWEWEPELSPERHRDILRDSHHSSSLFHINLLSEYLFLFQDLRWPNPEDERINLPGVESENNWSYRLRPSIEELVSHQGLKNLIQDLIQ